jgi:hypothetical protein
LNIDPTDEDSWTWDTTPGSVRLFYQAFDENGDPDANGGPGMTDQVPNLGTFMFEKNGRVAVDLKVQGTTVAKFGNNDDQVFPNDGSLTPTAGFNATGMTFVELDVKGGVFGNYDESDNANLDILDGPSSSLRGKSATIRYNDVSTSIVVGFGFGTLDMNVPDGTWGSGEEIPVTLVDSDANKNTRADEDLDLFDPTVALIPTLKIGNPFTLVQGDEAAFLSDVTVSGCSTVALCTVNSTSVANSADVSVEAFSQRARITPTPTSGSFTIGTNGALLVDLNRDITELQKSINNPTSASNFRGYNLFNYDVRSLGIDSTPTVNDVDIYLLINRQGTGNTVIDPTNSNLTGYSAVKLADNQPLQGHVNLNRTATGSVDPVNGHPEDTEINAELFSTANQGTDDIALLFVLNSATGITLDEDTKPIVSDFFSVGLVGDGVLPKDRINNSITRFELEETGDNTSTFIGSAEYTMLSQLNIFDAATYDVLRTIDDEATFIVHEDLDDEESPRINYLDLGSDGVSTQIADQQAAGTTSGVVSFDKDNYKTADTVTVTLQDNDLNVDSDTIDIYTTVNLPGDPADNTVGEAGLGTYANGDSFGRLFDVTFDDQRWTIPTDATCLAALTGAGVTDTGLAATGFTFVETSKDSGTFKGDFQVPARLCQPGSTVPVTSNGLDIEVNYVDFRDASGNTIEVGDGAGIRANTGSVSLDRTVYPVPFGEVTDFAVPTKSAEKPSGRAIFPVHATGIGDVAITPSTADLTLGNGDVLAHIRVNDPDFDISGSGEDKIAQNVAGENVGPVKIFTSRGSSITVIAYAGGNNTIPNGVIDVDDNNTPVGDGVTQLGPMVEIAPNAGIFESDLVIKYSDGPADNNCPISNAAIAARFDDTLNSLHNRHCILQGDILTVEYTDPSDSSGEPNTVTDSATFDLRNGVIQSDKSVYIIGADAILTLIEPDLNLDSDETETYDLDLIEWDSDAATVTMGNLGGDDTQNGAAFDPEPTDFRETGDNTGIFQVVVEIPNTLGGERLDRGEEIQLEYTDWGPSGANFVGDEDEDMHLTIYTSNFGATVELDQKVYTWTDKVFITIVAPDHNFDSNLVDKIGDTDVDEVRVATRGNKLSNYALTETGTDTGIFTGEVILTGFCHDADGDVNTGAQSITQTSTCSRGDDTNPRTGTSTGGVAVGPTDGYLESDDDDGLTVSFEFTEDETVVGSALIRWNIGEVQFLEASYPAEGQGVVRVVDPDMNLNPEAVDNFEVDTWSDSDAGGIDLTVTETNEATGIFEGTVFFTTTDQSSGHRLRVAEGDTVTSEYKDSTLPSPYTTADELEITATTFIGSIVPPLERAPASNPRIVDAFGNELTEVNVDQQIQIVADLANGQDRDQPFAYLVQIQDEDGVTVSLSWITGSLAPGQTLNPAQSWTPTSPGTYNVQLFVWESVDNPDALSPPVSTTISVV